MSETSTPEDWAVAAEQRVLDEALSLSVHEGWTALMTRRAGQRAGFSEGETGLLLPHGPADLAALLSRRHDARAMAVLSQVDAGSLKIRERIFTAVEARLDAAAADESALRRWAGFLALPRNLTLGARLAWDSADQLWRWAGDVATDENHYSKRAILAGILTGAIAIRLSGGRGEAIAFVQRRIEDVMRFEKWKATTSFRPSVAVAGFAEALGRMRYRA